MHVQSVSVAFLTASFLAALAAAPAARAAASASPYQVDFGPFVGGGSMSTGAEVKHTSGYSLAIERNWDLGSTGLSIGPRFEVSNAFVNFRDEANEDGVRTVGTYDNRIVAAGVRFGSSVGNSGTFAQGVYVTAMAGRGFSKLSVDESTDELFKQKLYGGISGNYFSSELGAWIPLKGSLGINLAVMTDRYSARQTDTGCTADGETLRGGNLVESSGSCDEIDQRSIPATAVLRSTAAKLGLTLGF